MAHGGSNPPSPTTKLLVNGAVPSRLDGSNGLEGERGEGLRSGSRPSHAGDVDVDGADLPGASCQVGVDVGWVVPFGGEDEQGAPVFTTEGAGEARSVRVDLVEHAAPF